MEDWDGPSTSNPGDEKLAIHVSSDNEFWGIVKCMTTGAYTVLYNLTDKYAVALVTNI